MAESKYVVFQLGSELYGLPIERVERILPEQPVVKVPKTPAMLLGIFDLRGDTVPTLDLRLRLDFSERTEAGIFVVVATNGARCALRVDGVAGIISLGEDQIDENPDLFARQDDDFIQAVGKSQDKLIVLLEPDNVVPADLRHTLSGTQIGVAA